MRKTLMTLFLLLACSVVTAAAQSQDQPQTDQQKTTSSSEMGKHIKITGCLQQGTDPNTYVLSRVSSSGMSEDREEARAEYPYEDQSDQTQANNAPSEMAKTETSYNLIPEDSVDLKSHIGHKVELTGEMIPSMSRADQWSRAATSGEKSSTVHGSSGMTGYPQFRVSSVRHISESCQ